MNDFEKTLTVNEWDIAFSMGKKLYVESWAKKYPLSSLENSIFGQCGHVLVNKIIVEKYSHIQSIFNWGTENYRPDSAVLEVKMGRLETNFFYIRDHQLKNGTRLLVALAGDRQIASTDQTERNAIEHVNSIRTGKMMGWDTIENIRKIIDKHYNPPKSKLRALKSLLVDFPRPPLRINRGTTSYPIYYHEIQKPNQKFFDVILENTAHYTKTLNKINTHNLNISNVLNDILLNSVIPN